MSGALVGYSNHAVSYLPIFVEIIQGASGDVTAPTITGQSPSNGAVKIATDTTIYFELDDDSSGVDSNTITVTIAGKIAILNGVFQLCFSGTIVADGLGYNVTITPDCLFSEGQLVTVSVSGVMDIAENLMATATWSFTILSETATIYWRNRLRGL